jgi:hypothetical protein
MTEFEKHTNIDLAEIHTLNKEYEIAYKYLTMNEYSIDNSKGTYLTGLFYQHGLGGCKKDPETAMYCYLTNPNENDYLLRKVRIVEIFTDDMTTRCKNGIKILEKYCSLIRDSGSFEDIVDRCMQKYGISYTPYTPYTTDYECIEKCIC